MPWSIRYESFRAYDSWSPLHLVLLLRLIRVGRVLVIGHCWPIIVAIIHRFMVTDDVVKSRPNMLKVLWQNLRMGEYSRERETFEIWTQYIPYTKHQSCKMRKATAATSSGPNKTVCNIDVTERFFSRRSFDWQAVSDLPTVILTLGTGTNGCSLNCIHPEKVETFHPVSISFSLSLCRPVELILSSLVIRWDSE